MSRDRALRFLRINETQLAPDSGCHKLAKVKRPDEEEATIAIRTAQLLRVPAPFDLARTTAPVWWARGRWPNVDWRNGAFYWVGWEAGRTVWRSARQVDARTLEISGNRACDLDPEWSASVLGTNAEMPNFDDPVLEALASQHPGLKPWSAGSLFEGVVSSIVGQSISVAAAATTERRLFELFNDGIDIDGRRYWPAPRPAQLATSSAEQIRTSGVTSKRAEALVAVGSLFDTATVGDPGLPQASPHVGGDVLLAVSGIGPWTVRSALLWGIGEADAHPTGDVALLRAARKHYSHVATLKDLDRLSEQWKPSRGWAARLLWLDLLGFDDHG